LIEIFEGEKRITKLDIYPVGFYPEREQLEKRLITRGSMVLDYQNSVHSEYGGSADMLLENHSILVSCTQVAQ